MSLADIVTSRYWTAAGLTMLNFLWVGALVGVFAACLRVWVGNQRPQLRYLAAIGCLAVQTAAPALIYVSVLAPSATANHPAAASAEAAAEWPSLTAGNGLTVNGPDSHDVGLETQLFWHARSTLALRSVLPPLGRALPWIWLVGSPVMLMLLLTGVIGSRRLCREVRSLAGTATDEQCLRICKALRIGRKVMLAVSDRIAAPVVIGIWRPTVLLPLSVWSGFEPVQIEMILWHELAHVRRYDNLLNLVERAIQSLLFFQPAVWFACRWVRLERENCCDAIALSHTSSPQAYAETLASLAAPGLRSEIVVASGANHQLVARIRYILRPNELSAHMARKVLPRLVFLTAAVGAIVIVGNQQESTSAKRGTPRRSPGREAGSVSVQMAGNLDASSPTAAASSPASPISARAHEDVFTARGERPDRVERPIVSGIPADASQTSGVAVARAPKLNTPENSSEPLDDAAERKQAAAMNQIAQLGGWCYVDESRRVVEEVNLAYRDTVTGREHNDTSAESTQGLRTVGAFPRLKRLSLYRGQATDEALSAVADLKELEIISSWHTQQVTDKGVQHLAGLQNLREVYFDVGQLGDGALAVFGTLPKLEVLRMLIGNEVTDSGLRHLVGATHLRELAIGQGKHPITDAGVAYLTMLVSLENLNVQDSQISPAGVDRLKALPRLQVLRVNADELYQRRRGEWVRVDG